MFFSLEGIVGEAAIIIGAVELVDSERFPLEKWPISGYGLVILGMAVFLVNGFWMYREQVVKARQLEALGRSALQQGRLDDAMTAYRKALRLSPNHLEARLALSQAMAASGDLAGALEQLDHLNRTHPREAVVHFGRCNILFRLRRFADAVRAYRLGLEYQNDVAALCMLAQACEQIGRITGSRSRRVWEKRSDLLGTDRGALLPKKTAMNRRNRVIFGRFDRALRAL